MVPTETVQFRDQIIYWIDVNLLEPKILKYFKVSLKCKNFFLNLIYLPCLFIVNFICHLWHLVHLHPSWEAIRRLNIWIHHRWHYPCLLPLPPNLVCSQPRTRSVFQLNRTISTWELDQPMAFVRDLVPGIPDPWWSTIGCRSKPTIPTSHRHQYQAL